MSRLQSVGIKRHIRIVDDMKTTYFSIRKIWPFFKAIPTRRVCFFFKFRILHHIHHILCRLELALKDFHEDVFIQSAVLYDYAKDNATW